ncbi:MAG: ABC transporter permease [Deltaproteobacteria bacterium]|jgi:peptide/nickel transport system permease protein|nr:ABC transporter permease [Deltaproteobacteria bacterium]
MLRFAIRRIIHLVPTILGMMFILFTMLYFTPGDPAVIALGDEATPESVQAFHEEHGLDKPFLAQFGNYVWKVFTRGDLGYSYSMKSEVSREVFPRVPTTMKLAFAAVLISTIFGIPLGIICAIRQYSLIDTVATLVTLFGISTPTFWTGMLFILAFSVHLGWLPSMGFDTLSEMVLPILTLSGTSMAIIARMTRSSMLEVIKADYIRTARSKGQKESVIIFRHALPNALIPIMTIIGIQFGGLLAGSIVTEAIFSISGIGRLMIEAIKVRDYPIIQGGVLFISIAFSLVNLVVDLLYALVDPRIRIK